MVWPASSLPEGDCILKPLVQEPAWQLIYEVLFSASVQMGCFCNKFKKINHEHIKEPFTIAYIN